MVPFGIRPALERKTLLLLVRIDLPVARPADYARTVVDVVSDEMIRRAALVVERHHPLRRPRHVGHDEPNARIQFARMPLYLRHHAAGLAPRPGLIAEAGMKPPHLMRRSTNWALQQPAYTLLQDSVRRKPHRVFVALCFKERINVRMGQRRRRHGSSGASFPAGSGPPAPARCASRRRCAAASC
jgi:hypothetical protein